MEEVQQEKKILEKEKPGAELSDVAPPSDEVQAWLGEEVNVLEMAAAMLQAEGVDTVFGLTSGFVWPTEMAVLKQGIKRVHVRHEQAATFAADAFGRLSRTTPGIALVGLATGICYASAGVAQAYAAQTPMVVIQPTSGNWDDDLYMGQGIVRAYKVYDGITKWTRRVNNPAILLFELKRAIRSAMTPPTGPVCIEIPGEFHNVAWHRGPRANFLLGYDPATWSGKTEPMRCQADAQRVDKMMQWLMSGEKPCMVTGEGVAIDDAMSELQEFVALTGIPTHCRRNSRGAISEYDPLNSYGRARGAVMRNADRAVILGLRIGFLEQFGYPPFFGPTVQHAQIQSCRENVNLAVPNTVHEVVGSPKLVLRQMIDWLKEAGIKKPPEKWANWRQYVVDAKTRYEKRAIEATKPMRGKLPLHPDLMGMLIAEFLRDELNDEYLTIIDSFTGATYFSDWQKVKFAPSMLDASETIGFGHSPGMAIGAALATDRKIPIVAVMGDGAIGAGGMDIETCSRWNVPAIFIHYNNNNVVTGSQYFFTGKLSPTGNPLWDTWATLPWIHYEKMFTEFGCHAECIERDSDVKPALKRSLDFVRQKCRPAFIEAFIDPDPLQEIWTTFLVPMCVGSMHWDDMEPGIRKLVDETWDHTSALAFPWMHPSWQEGIEKYRKDKGGR